MKTPTLFPDLEKTLAGLRTLEIPAERKKVLQPLIDYIQRNISQDKPVNLNFICTHNSRRSQFSQVWAQTAADYYTIPAKCYSGGVETTAFNERAVASVVRAGFKVSAGEGANPIYEVYHSEDSVPILTFSKRFDDPANDADRFAAVMTCSDADENCPYIPGAEARIPVRYEDPKSAEIGRAHV